MNLFISDHLKAPETRYDIFLLIDVTNSNLNKDGDQDDLHRIDSEGKAIFSPVSWKYQHRCAIDYLVAEKEDITRYQRLIKQDAVINNQLKEVYDEAGLAKASKMSRKEKEDAALLEMLNRYYDARYWGAVLSTGKNKASNYNGPFQCGWGQSYDPVNIKSAMITRCAATEEDKGKDNKTIGRMNYIEYGLFSVRLTYSPQADKFKTMTSDDLELFWNAAANMYEITRTSSKNSIAMRGFYVFSHLNQRGDEFSHNLFESIKVAKTCGGNPMSYSDYSVSVDESRLERFYANGGQLTLLGI